MFKYIQLDEKTAVAGQLQPGDMAKAAAAGFTLIVNNRPDGESWGQPKAKDIAAAAAKAGIAYVDLPFSMPQSIQPEHVAGLARLLNETEGSVLAFCRSGNRSLVILAAAKVAQGEDITQVLAKTARAGWDLRQSAQFIELLADAARK